ncbi:MAG: AsmA family protein [Nevskia sp.]|nr:AsmA family protein [Nevskia sp.]
MNHALKVLLVVVGTIAALLVVAGVAFTLLFDANKYRGHISAQVQDATGRKLEIERLQVSLFPVVGVRIRNARMDNAPGFGDQPFAQVGEAQLSVRLLPLLLHRRLQVGRVTLKDAQLNLIRRADGRGDWEDLVEKTSGPGRPAAAKPPPPAAGGQGLAGFEIAGIDIDNAAVGFEDQRAHTRFGVSRFTLKTGSLSMSGTTDVKLGFSIAQSQPQVDADLSLSVQVALDVPARKLDLSKIRLELKATGAGAAPGWQDLLLTADAHFDDSRKSLAVTNLRLEAGPDSITGEITVPAQGAPVQFALKSDHLDLDRLLPPAPAGAAPAGPQAQARVAEQPLPFDALDAVNASGTVDIGQLTVKGMHLSRVHAVFDAARGTEKHAGLKLALYGGGAEGDTRIGRSQRPWVRQSARISGVDIGALLRDWQGRARVSGVLDASFDVTGAGASLSEIRHSLDGAVSLNLRNGALQGFNLAQLMRQGQAMRQGQPLTDGAGAQTDFSAIAGTGKIKDGVLHSDDLRGESPLLRIQGSGDVDLGNATIDYLAKPALVNTATGQGGKPLAQLQSVVVPIRISGPLAAPQYRLDVGEAVKQKLIDKLGDRNGGLVEQIQNLFGKKKQP